MSDVLLGLIGKDYVLVACDADVARSIVVYKQDEDKIIQLDENKIIGAAG
jgi:20S proteasome subunit beta 4